MLWGEVEREGHGMGEWGWGGVGGYCLFVLKRATFFNDAMPWQI